MEITRIKEEVNNLMAIFAASRDPDNADRTVMVEADVLQSVTAELASVTDDNDAVTLPNDLTNTVDIVGTTLRFI